MAKKANQSSNYREALKQLLHLLNTEYRNGGKLPPAPIMAEKFGVSLVTYHKAQKIICREGLANAEANKNGTYVLPVTERRKKVGIVFEYGAHSPFISLQKTFSAFLNVMDENQIHTHLIQGTSPEDILEESELLETSGMAWFSPPPKQLPLLEKINARIKVPFVTVTNDPVFRESGLPIVTLDLEYHTRIKTDIIKKFRTEKVLCPYVKSPDFLLFRKYLEDYGISLDDNSFLEVGQLKTHFYKRLEETEAELLLCDLGSTHMNAILELLKTVPPEKQPAIIISLPPVMLDGLRKKYPYARFAGLLKTHADLIGEVLGKEMCGHIRNNTAFGHVAVRASEYLQLN